MDSSYYRELVDIALRAMVVVVVVGLVAGVGCGFLLGRCDRLPTVEVHWK